MLLYRVIAYFVLIQQVLITVESLSKNYLRFSSALSYTYLLSTTTDSPTLSFVGDNKIDKRDIELTVVNSAILSVS